MDEERVDRRRSSDGGHGRYEKDRGHGYHPYDRKAPNSEPRRRFEGRSHQQEMKNKQYDEAEEVQNRLKSLIVRVGDKSTSSLESNLEGLAKALEDEVTKQKSTIVECIMRCVVALPVKIPVYGTLVGLINAKNFEVGADIVQRTSTQLQAALDNNQFNDIKYLTRFVGELVNSSVLPPSAIIDLLNQYLEIVAQELTSESSESHHQRRADFFLYVTLITLPFVGRELNERKQEDLQTMLNIIQNFFSKRTAKPNPVLHIFESDAHEDYMVNLWKIVSQLHQGNEMSDGAPAWEVGSTLKPYASFEAVLNGSTSHAFPSINIPSSNSTVLFPHKIVFRLFDSDADKLNAIDKILIEDYVIDILYHFSLSHKDCIKMIQQFPIEASFDHLLIETIFSQLFALPKPTFKEIYYAVLIVDWCKTKPALFPLIGRVIMNLFDRLDQLDVECNDRFSTWFAFHLSNFDFKWIWSGWDYILQSKEDNVRTRFVNAVLDKTMRLSYHERVKKSLPEEFHELMPEKPAPNFKYDSDQAKYKNEANLLLEKLRAKESPDNIANGLLENDALVFRPNREETIDLLVSCLLKLGSKSFSHLLATFERYVSLVKRYVATQEHKQQVLNCINDFWGKSTQHIFILIDRMLTYKVIDASSVIEWVYADGKPDFTSHHVRDITRNAIDRTIGKLEPIREELKSAEEALEKVPQEERNEDIPEMRRVKDRKSTIEALLEEQKEVFILVLQKHCSSLAAFTSENTDNADPKSTLWYRAATEFLKEIGRKYHENVKPFMATLESLLFSNADQRVVELFQNIKNI
eukprot:TRINITY_DN3790_c0_g1_i1.p1 TRINITY_DN3790_c0_g1~~TRINITY_DN3790_c0_g1_i1.p1  ORF type:complete len:829 (-),score=226.89 TRINITY_DN3790_c0_g1_i1:25-2442(-)